MSGKERHIPLLCKDFLSNRAVLETWAYWAALGAYIADGVESGFHIIPQRRMDLVAADQPGDGGAGRLGITKALHISVDFHISVDYATFMNANELKRWLSKQGCTFETHKGGSGHLTVYREGKTSQLPQHGAAKELGTGLVNKIKKDLGLK